MEKINPETTGMHPLRHSLTDADWERIRAYCLYNNTTVIVTSEELDAFADWIFDEIAAKQQTVAGSTTLQ